MKKNSKFVHHSEYVQLNNVLFTHTDIFNVIDSFYQKVERDPILSVPFQSVADWPEHIERMTQFWWIRFGGKPYMFSYYNPVPKHFFAGFNPHFLSHWLHLFHQTLDERLDLKKAQVWKIISIQMGKGLLVRNEHFRKEYESEEFRQDD